MKKCLLGLVVGVLILAVLFIGAISLANRDPYIVRNLALAIVAHQKAHDKVPFDIDVARVAPFTEFGITSNSRWLVDYTRVIVPTLVYENISANEGVYPKTVAFFPKSGTSHFHIAGQANPNKNTLILNERYVLTNSWNDQREALSTLVHELTHLQGSAFNTGVAEEFEPRTQAATLEVLAAMCNYGDPVSCASFWHEVEDYARTVVWVRMEMHGAGWLYQRVSDVLFRDRWDEMRAAKSSRFWEGDQERLQYILRAYSMKPYRYFIYPGVRENKSMLLGQSNRLFDFLGYGNSALYMKFDDTQALLGIWSWLVLVPPVEGK